MSLIYNIWKENGSKAVWLADTIKLMQVVSAYTPNADHEFVNSGSGAANPLTNECSGTGYVRKTLASKTGIRDTTNDRLILAAANVLYTTPNGYTVRRYVVYRDNGGGDATNDLICCIDGGNLSPSGITMNGADFMITWTAAGVLLAA